MQLYEKWCPSQLDVLEAHTSAQKTCSSICQKMETPLLSNFSLLQKSIINRLYLTFSMLSQSDKRTEPSVGEHISTLCWKRALRSPEIWKSASWHKSSRGGHPAGRVRFISYAFWQLLDLHIRRMAGFFQWLIQLKYVRACCCPGQDIDVGDLDIFYLFIYLFVYFR